MLMTAPFEAGSHALCAPWERMQRHRGSRGPSPTRSHAQILGQGWPAEPGARMAMDDGAIATTMPDSSAVLVNHRLDVPVADKPYVSLDLKCASAQTASLAFITDQGYGETPVHLWHVDRPSILKMPYNPNWRGRMKLIAIAFPDGTNAAGG